jgi:HEAT repeat protein
MKKLVLALAGLALGVLPVLGADVPELIKQLGSGDNEVRRKAAQELAEAGASARAAVPALTKALRDRDLYVRRFAATALGAIGPEAKSAIPALSTALNDGKKQVRTAAVKALGKMGADSVPALSKALKNPNTDVQESAIDALGTAGPAGVPGLSDLVRDARQDASMRRKAVEALRRQGKEARPAVPALTSVARELRGRGRDFGQLRIDAVVLLGQLATKDDAAAISILQAIAENPRLRDKTRLKREARRSLARIEGKPFKKGKKK